MLKKQYRLKKYSAIIATYKQKNIVADSNLCIYIGKEKKDSAIQTKIAFVVSKKIHKRAVKRNRIKRLMRENFRLLIKNSQTGNINKYLSVICTAKENAINADLNSIKNSLVDLLSKIS